MKRTTLFLLLLCLTTLIAVVAQPLCQIKHFSVNDGLAQGIVTDMLQDQKGFMWFSTWNGLNKYDGYSFRNYKSFPGDGCTLSNNRITSIQENKYGNIWCHSYDRRAYLFDTHTEQFIDVLQPIEAQLKQTNSVQTIYSLPKGVTWIVCYGGNCFRIDEQQYRQDNSGITLYNTFNKNLKGTDILQIFEDSEGDEWILTDKGISLIGKKKINSDFPFHRYQELERKIWLTSPHGKLACYDLQTQKLSFAEIPFPIQRINTLLLLNRDTLALGTDNGLLLFYSKDKSYQQIDVRTPSQPSSEVNYLYKDRANLLWMFTPSPGITRLNLSTREKQHLHTPSAEVIKHERANTPFIYEDKESTLWIIPREGNFCYYNRQTEQLNYFYTDAANPTSRYLPLIRRSYTDNQDNFWYTSNRGLEKLSFFPSNYQQQRLDEGFEIRAFLRDRQQRLWVTSKSGKIRIYHSNGSLQGYLTRQGTISPHPSEFFDNAYCLTQDSDGNIWMGTKRNGLYLLKQTTDDAHAFHITHHTHQPNDAYSLSNNSVYSVLQDSQQRIWVGCYGGGINLLETTPDGKTHFIHSGNRLKNFPATLCSRVRHLAQAANGTLLIGTTDGLITFSPSFNQPEEIKFYRNIRKPTAASSLSSNDVMQLYTDSQKETYVVTFAGGINKITSHNLLTEEIAFKAYTVRNGLASDLTLSIVEAPKGTLWIVSENTLTRMDPKKETFDHYGKHFFKQEFNFSEAIPAINSSGKFVFGTDGGIIEVAPTQMTKSSYCPPIAFTGLKIQGSASPIAIDAVEELTLQPSQRNVTFSFAALDFVNSEEIRYAYRLAGLDSEWNYVDKSRSANYIHLPKGTYRFQVKSTNSDGVWVDNVRTLTIHVSPTFGETLWAWLLYALLFILFTATIVYILFYIYRLRHQVDVEQQLSNIKLRFFTDISHELRTPLTLISSPVTEVLEHEPLSPVAREHLTLVQNNTNRMLRLVNQILDFRKIQNKKMKVLVEETDLIPLLSKVMESFHGVAIEKQIDYRFVTDRQELMAWVDKDKFEKILFNLLSNAFKYTPTGKAISVRVATDEETISIAVSDEGIGIPTQKLGSLFQRFETLAHHNEMQPSSGIGLSLVKELVELHHGTIEVNSHPGTGSEFRVKLRIGKNHFAGDVQAEFILSDLAETADRSDLAETVPTTPSLLPQEEAEENDEERLSILIVEDNRELRAFLRNILCETYTVAEAEDGQAGLEKALQLVPDLIISDVMMPVMDGLDMVKGIKEHTDICHIPVILLSAKSSLDDRIAGLEQGIDDYITKPFSATYLKTRISTLLSQRKFLQAFYLSTLGGKTETTPTELSPSQPTLPTSSLDEKFISQVMGFMEKNMDNSDLTIDDFADTLLLSRTVFYRKLKSLVGLTPVDFIREIRIKRAIQLMERGEYNISQIAYMTGFNDPKYFSKCFKKQTGATPTEYAKIRTQ